MVIQPCQPDTSVDLVDHAPSDRTAGKQGKDQASYPHKNQRLREPHGLPLPILLSPYMIGRRESRFSHTITM